jgi:hypothetical protein
MKPTFTCGELTPSCNHIPPHNAEKKSRTTNTWNLWEFVYLGVGKSGKDEYHLIHTHNGKYMAGEHVPSHRGIELAS